jgi:hypothetical protein
MAAAALAGEKETMLPSTWRYLVLALSLAIAVNWGLARQPPPPAAMVCFLLAMCGILSLRSARRAELAAYGARRYLPVVLAVLVPMAAFGAGLVLWATDGALAREEVIATIVAVSTVAVAHFRRHAALIFAIQMAVWAPVILFGSPVIGLVSLAIGAVAAVLMAREQSRLDPRARHSRRL